MNHRLARALAIEASEIERTNPASARAMRSHILKYMPEHDYNALWTAQDGKCAICRQVCIKALALDHCHKTGRIRGLLCMRCNTALGLLKDDQGLLSKAIEYLQKDDG